jgi:ribosomal protein S18 acetylase RimI-like enzyme
MSIRIWNILDLVQITNLMNELNHDLNENRDISVEIVKEHYFEMKESKVYESYVFEEQNEILGFISLVFYRTIFHKVGTALINELIVKNKFRNKGIGRALLEKAIDEAKRRNMDEIEVGVMIENKKAIEFYKRNGLNDEYYILGKDFN